jgi:hypothetical protein
LSNIAIQGHDLAPADYGSYLYLTINAGAANMEVVRATTNSSNTFTLDKRGLAWYGEGDTELSAFKFAHAAGEPVIVSDVKNVFDQMVDKTSDETVGGIKTFSSSPKVPLVPSAAADVPSKNYVDLAVSSATGLTDFLVSKNGSDPTLTVNVNAGELLVSDTLITYAGASAQAVTALSTNYVQITFAGTLVINTTGFIDGNVPLATVATDATTITGVTDKRPFFTIGPDNQVIDTTFTYGATLAVGDPVRVNASASNKLIKALGTSAANADGFIGIALDAGVDTNTNKRVLIGGRVTGLSGLTPDAPVYLTDAGGFSATAGAYKKMVGWATTATTMVLLPTFSPANLSGVDSSVTATALNSAGAFFATTKRQQIKQTVTAGHDLAQGELIAIESDGKAYRTRPTGFSTSNAGTATNFTTTELGSTGKMYWFDTTNDKIKCFLGLDTNASPDNFKSYRITVDSGFDAISSTTNASGSLANAPGIYDAILHNSSTQVTICGRAATGEVQAISFDSITTTPSFGSAITLEASDSGAGITDTSSASILVAFSNGGGTELRSHKITFSGTTLTESTNASMVASATAIPFAAGRFSGTDFIAVAYYESGTGALKVVVGEYTPSTGTWVLVGTPITLEASGMSSSNAVYIVPISSTKVAVYYSKSTDYKLLVITRSSGTAATAGSATTLSGTSGTNGTMSFKKIGTYSFMAGYDTNAGGKLQIVALNRDMTAFSTVGSAITEGSVAARTIAGCLLIPTRWLAMYQDSATTTKTNTRELNTNLASMIGVIESAVATDATANAIVNGYSDDFTGLVTGSEYYTAIDGQLTTSDSGMGPLTSSLNVMGKVRRAVTAYSATEGNISS